MSYLVGHINFLFFLLFFLIALSVFFSLSETAMLSVNPYRIRYLVRQNNHLALRVQRLLERPDRMLGVILFCDTFADIFASAIATLLAIHYLGDQGVLWVTIALTFVVLILGEIAPKTLATIYPLRIALFAAWPLTIFLRVLYPVIWLVNSIANGMLRVFGVRVKSRVMEHLSHEELRTVVHEAGSRLPADYRSMMLHVLDLEKATVEDIMVPRNDIVGIDLSDELPTIIEQLAQSQHTRLPIYREEIGQTVGMLHLRKVLNLLAQGTLTKEILLEIAEEPYFIPEGTPLNIQLINFRREKHRTGLVVNEYGDIEGLVALEDILEEIVGEFTTDMLAAKTRTMHPQSDGSYLVDGTISIRELNRVLHCDLPLEGPKTLSGIIIEYLEMIPPTGIALKIGKQPMEVVAVKGNTVKTVRILPQVTANKTSGKV